MNLAATLPQAAGDAARGRYPGAQPFLDDDLSRKVFFGRHREQDALANQVMAQRLVVVYARSGYGKTSLLQAGIANRLRAQGFVPLFTRVNDTERGPVASVLDDIAAEADRQQIEYVPGDPRTLWWFFKTTQFWRNDRLLVPVLVCDQFEEIFTLIGLDARNAFLSQLGELTRGVRTRDLCEGAPSFSPDSPISELSESAPQVHVVIGIREDYLGYLEEASDRIPDILHQRFRLAALRREDAIDAINGPAKLEDSAFAVPAFSFDPLGIERILDFLAARPASSGESDIGLGLRRAIKTTPSTDARIEPFQLQLICQRAEELVQRTDRRSGTLTESDRQITFNDLGGERGVRAILRDFFVRQIQKLPGWRVRRRARYLCGEVLISPTGRRLSVEQSEVERRTKLTRDHLDVLVNARLLRADQRADSTYFELSHDSLVQPIRASRMLSRGILGAGNIVKAASAAVLGLSLLAILIATSASLVEDLLLGLLGILLLGTAAAFLFRVAWRSAFRARDVLRR